MIRMRNSMLPICFTKPAAKADSVCVHHRGGVARVGHAHHVPPHDPLPELRPLLEEVAVLHPELRLVVLAPAAPVDAPDVELPGVAAEVAGGLQGDAVADLPAEPRGELAADHHSLPVRLELLPFVGVHHELRVHGEPRVGVDRELRKEVLRLLVDPPEPGGVRHFLHAVDPLDARVVGQGERLDESRAPDDHEPVRPRHVDALVEARAERGEEREQEEGHEEGPDRERRPDLLAEEVGEQERQELHEAASR
jgi:hypothetical protein